MITPCISFPSSLLEQLKGDDPIVEVAKGLYLPWLRDSFASSIDDRRSTSTYCSLLNRPLIGRHRNNGGWHSARWMQNLILVKLHSLVRQLYAVVPPIIQPPFLKITGWLQGSTISSRANTVPIYILTSKMCFTHVHTAIHFIFVPFHLQTTEIKIEMLVVEKLQMVST